MWHQLSILWYVLVVATTGESRRSWNPLLNRKVTLERNEPSAMKSMKAYCVGFHRLSNSTLIKEHLLKDCIQNDCEIIDNTVDFNSFEEIPLFNGVNTLFLAVFFPKNEPTFLNSLVDRMQSNLDHFGSNCSVHLTILYEDCNRDIIEECRYLLHHIFENVNWFNQKNNNSYQSTFQFLRITKRKSVESYVPSSDDSLEKIRRKWKSLMKNIQNFNHASTVQELFESRNINKMMEAIKSSVQLEAVSTESRDWFKFSHLGGLEIFSSALEEFIQVMLAEQCCETFKIQAKNLPYSERFDSDLAVIKRTALSSYVNAINVIRKELQKLVLEVSHEPKQHINLLLKRDTVVMLKWLEQTLQKSAADVLTFRELAGDINPYLRQKPFPPLRANFHYLLGLKDLSQLVLSDGYDEHRDGVATKNRADTLQIEGIVRLPFYPRIPNS